MRSDLRKQWIAPVSEEDRKNYKRRLETRELKLTLLIQTLSFFAVRTVFADYLYSCVLCTFSYGWDLVTSEPNHHLFCLFRPVNVRGK